MEGAMIRSPKRRRQTERRRGAIGTLIAGGMLCGLVGTAQARDHDRVGVRVNTGIAWHENTRYVIAGGAIDVPVSRAIALVADGQLHGSVDTDANTLAAGVRVQPWRGRGVSPYVTAGAGVWNYSPRAWQRESEGYLFVGVGAWLRLSRAVSAFGEIRTRPLFRKKSDFDAGTPLIVGVRVGF
jgi:hypothetical protein